MGARYNAVRNAVHDAVHDARHEDTRAETSRPRPDRDVGSVPGCARIPLDYLTATTASISTSAPRGNPDTCTVARAGRASPNHRP